MAGLRIVYRHYRFLTSDARWGQRTMVHTREDGWRRRLYNEKIENNLGAYHELRAEIATMVEELTRLDELARYEIVRLRQERREAEANANMAR